MKKMKILSRLRIQAAPDYYEVQRFAEKYGKDLDKITEKIFSPLFSKFKGKPTESLYEDLSGYIFSAARDDQYQFLTKFSYGNEVVITIEVIYVPLQFRLHINGRWPFDIAKDKKDFENFSNDMILMKGFESSFKSLLKKSVDEMRKFIKEKSPELYKQIVE